MYKILKTILKNTSAYFCIFYLTFQPVLAQTVPNNALPTNPTVTSGSATFNQTTNQLTINQATDKLITNWSSFNIGRDATVTFNQPSSLSSALNRVNSSDPSYIFGKLNANGQVILLNQSGVIFGNGAKFDAGTFIASTLNIKDTDFLNGKMIFEKDGYAGSITNYGDLSAFKGGAVALIAPQIINNGTITAESGTAALLSGNKVTLTLNGNKLVKYSIDEGALNSYIENNNAIKVDDGTIILSARALDELSKSVISNSGIIEAKGISTKGGKILLEGDDITLKSTSVVDASGNFGGGEVLIGGDYQGKNPDIRNAKTVTAEQGSITKADAITDGDGGKIIFWSDDRTVFLGEASVSGGENSGDGGFGEISGKNRLLFDGLFRSPSKTGKIGSLLLDPTDIV
ncbi:MAG: filamentous hemagglutinin N-terminal domain-containing protein, partial [Actinomycetes bacterium]